MRVKKYGIIAGTPKTGERMPDVEVIERRLGEGRGGLESGPLSKRNAYLLEQMSEDV